MEDNKEIKTEVDSQLSVEKVEPKTEKELPDFDSLFVKNNQELKEWVINLFNNLEREKQSKKEEKQSKKELDDF